ncbi:methyl-accepting chemotaxis protein [Photobacterium makurazakiensis]|uniref:methyl-accepting chemotaxis protein n=1 Tax=Photobacterium makurazakiensis TaxID=2910234 RepID=UPI003D0BF501
MERFHTLRAISISKRLYLLGITITLLTLLPLLLFASNYQQNLMEQKRVKTRHLVETVHSLVDYYHQQEQQGVLSREAAQHQVKTALSQLRYEQEDYFWIHDLTPNMIMHPFKPSLNGTSLANFTDPHGTPLFVEMTNLVRQQGSGFIDYYWEKPGHTQPIEKISYVKGFTAWGWIIGSGIYIDDVKALFWGEIKQLGWILLGTLSITFVLAWSIGRSITVPCRETLKAMQDIAEGDGDLTKRLPSNGNDELTQLAHAYNRFANHLGKMLNDIAPVSEQISAAATQLNSVASETAHSAKASHHGIDSVAAAMHQLHTNNQDIAKSAQQAADSAITAHRHSDSSIAIVTNSSNEMHALLSLLDETNDSAHHLEKDSLAIGSVLDVIRSIAEQTNLLALNAAIEAARAGEQGRGFAVVADEVRTLATRTQTSTNEIEEIISNLQSRANSVSNALTQTREQSASTAEHANHVAQTLSEIGEHISEIKILNQHIADSSDQQSSAAEEININLNQLTEHSQKTVQQGDHIASASEQLLANGRNLANHVGHFKI